MNSVVPGPSPCLAWESPSLKVAEDFTLERGCPSVLPVSGLGLFRRLLCGSSSHGAIQPTHRSRIPWTSAVPHGGAPPASGGQPGLTIHTGKKLFLIIPSIRLPLRAGGLFSLGWLGWSSVVWKGTGGQRSCEGGRGCRAPWGTPQALMSSWREGRPQGTAEGLFHAHSNCTHTHSPV